MANFIAVLALFAIIGLVLVLGATAVLRVTIWRSRR